MITIGAIPDSTAMGLEVQAEVMIEVEPGMVESVAVVLGDHGEVGYLATTTGRFNLSAAISVASQADLLDFCENAVGKLQGVRRVEPWVILRMYKAFGTPTTALIEAAERARKGAE